MPTTYYISTTGDDTDAGTEAAPWETLSTSITKVAAGDTIRIYDGNYVDNNLIVLDELINNLTITSDSEDKTKVSITNTLHQYWFDMDKALTGAVIQHLTFNQLSGAVYAQATFQDCTFNTVEYAFQNFGPGTVIQRCQFNCVAGGSDNQKIAIVFKGVSGAVTIDSCLFTNYMEKAILADESGCIIRNCTIISAFIPVAGTDDAISQANLNHQYYNTIIYSYQVGALEGYNYAIDFNPNASNQARMCIAAGIYGTDYWKDAVAPLVMEQLEDQTDVAGAPWNGKLFVNLAAADYHPDPAGIAYQRGYATSFPVTDLNGNPFNNPPSIGCLEDPPAPAGGGGGGGSPRVNNINNLNNLKL
jgi:hypothetical protein